MRDAENIRKVEQLFTLHSSLFTFWMGFIFYPKSSRYVSERPEYLPTKCKRVGVFVNEEVENIKKIADDYALDFIQLHGHETPEQISHLSKATGRRDSGNLLTSHLSIIKAFNIATKEDLEKTAPYAGLADYFLFDTKGPSAGGNGEKFDWSILDAYNGDTPFLLSGGIGPDDAERILRSTSGRSQGENYHHPKCIGIDLNSRFEIEPGIKDIIKLKMFLNYGK
jgi:phosphoribosylanthranilate isomerase